MSVELMSLDNEVFTLDAAFAERSDFIKNAIRDTPINLPEISSSVLKKVTEYCQYHRNDPVFVEDETEDPHRRSNDLEEWDVRFFQVDNGMLLKIILAAHHLDIMSLHDDGCKIVANMMKGKTAEEIRQMFETSTPGPDQKGKRMGRGSLSEHDRHD
ncbi:hypothetical protein BGX26_006310 [Mortierella sp. AD094]|nr:hypothetical protein BGX26_006310 [Mortierella sp. AD094]